jgi:hypothetical protein
MKSIKHFCPAVRPVNFPQLLPLVGLTGCDRKTRSKTRVAPPEYLRYLPYWSNRQWTGP